MSTSRARARGRSLRSDDADIIKFFQENFFFWLTRRNLAEQEREKEKSSAQKEKEKKRPAPS